MRSRVPFTLRRIGAYRLVLTAAAVSTAVTAALIAALITFTGQVLGQAAHRELAAAAGTSVAIHGQADAAQAGADTTAIRADMQSAFGPSGFSLYRAEWSDLLALPARYAGADKPLTQAAWFGGIGAHAVLVSGRWPAVPRPGQPVPAALPAAAAALLHLSPGDLLVLHHQVSGLPVRVRLTGVFRPAAGQAALPGLNLVGARGASTAGGFTTYGPLVVNRAAFGPVFPVSEASWLASPATRDIPPGAMTAVAAKISRDERSLQSLGGTGGLQVATALPAVLSGIGSNLVVARSLLAVAAIQLVLLAGFALAATARLLTTDRLGESALLAARGGSRWQLTKAAFAEAGLLTVLAAAVGGLTGGGLAALLAHSGPLQAAGLRLQPLSWAAAVAVAVTAAFATLILLEPGLRRVAPGTARARRGRQAVVSGLARSGADLALLVLAGLAIWQLHGTLIVAPSASGAVGIDPVLVLAPALTITGGAVAGVRLLPVAVRGCERLAARSRRLALPLASWELGRHPVRQAGTALLVVMAVATSTLALAEHQSWIQSAHDQADFTAGADVRVDTPAGLSLGRARAIYAAPGVSRAMPAAPLTTGGQTEVLALDARQAAGVALLRPGVSPRPLANLFGAITPTGPAPGLALPGRPPAVSLTLALGPPSLRLPPVPVTVTVADAEGAAAQIPAGTLPADGRPHTLTADVAAGALPPAAYPLRLASVTLDYTLPPVAAPEASLTVLRMAEPRSPGSHAVTWSAPGTALRGWHPAVSSAEYTALRTSPAGLAGPGTAPATGTWAATGSGGQSLLFLAGYGLAAPPKPHERPTPISGEITLLARPESARPLSAIATRAFTSGAHTAVGSTVQVSVAGATLPARIVAVLPSFPSVPPATGALVVDLAALQQRLISRSLVPVPVTEWWLATHRAGGTSALAAPLPPGSVVTSSAGVATRLLSNPLSAAPQQALLAIGAVAALLAITGLCVSIAANISRRRPQAALLAALGVPRRAQARQLCLAELMLSMPAAAAGLALGALVSTLFVPATTLTQRASRPVPPVITDIPWLVVTPLALAVVTLPAIAAACATARRRDPAAGLRTPESA